MLPVRGSNGWRTALRVQRERGVAAQLHRGIRLLKVHLQDKWVTISFLSFTTLIFLNQTVIKNTKVKMGSTKNFKNLLINDQLYIFFYFWDSNLEVTSFKTFIFSFYDHFSLIHRHLVENHALIFLIAHNK